MTSVLSNDVTNQLWEGDCLKLLPNIAGNSADFILTDPPYITNYRSRDGRSVPNDNNDAWLKPAFAELYRVLKPDSFAVSFYGWPKADRFLTAFRAAGFRVVGHLVFPKRYTSKTQFVRYQHEAAYLLEAEATARALRKALVERKVHADVLRFCRAELVADNYFHAVFETTKSLAEKLRQKTGLQSDGAQLVDEALAMGQIGCPRLAFNSLTTPNERNEHQGLISLIKGVFSCENHRHPFNSASR
jgi:uncharacterized protein (TIGR02391 family)